MTVPKPGALERLRRLVAGTRLEAPARRVARVARRALYGDAGTPAAPMSPLASDAPMFVPPGHFYSPIPSVGDVDRYRDASTEPPPDDLTAIDLRVDAQVRLFESWSAMLAEQPFSDERDPATRYWFENPSFSYGDALALYCMLRELEPSRVIEIGSGWSSCVVLDTAERFLRSWPDITFVEPYPEQLNALVREDDLRRSRLLPVPVQEVALAEFEQLTAGDVLFIDSTHVSRVGSDVNYEIFEILPRLQAGVYVHFHDIFYPFDYPVPWVEEGRGWNEAYVLRAFLEFNPAFEIVLFNDLLSRRLGPRLAEACPTWAKNPGGSFWLRKTA